MSSAIVDSALIERTLRRFRTDAHVRERLPDRDAGPGDLGDVLVEGVVEAELAVAELADGGAPVGGSAGEQPVQLVSGVAPNLTHFASRRTYAGGIFELYDDEGNVNRGQLEAWLRNPPAEKPMAPEARGMPNLQLQEEQIDQLVAFLETLD